MREQHKIVPVIAAGDFPGGAVAERLAGEGATRLRPGTGSGRLARIR